MSVTKDSKIAPIQKYEPEGDNKEEGIKKEEVVEEEESNMLSRGVNKICSYCLDPFTLEVLTYAVACSSDNIGIYISLFSSSPPLGVLIIIILFYILLILNVVIALLMMKVTLFDM